MIKRIYKNLIPEKQRIRLRLFVLKLISPFYSGTTYYCVCCNKSSRKFKPKGNIKRENAECPYCQSLERVRLLDYYLQNETNLYERRGLKLLHFAPEKCLFDKFNKLDIEYVDGDINADYARNIVDITNIGFDDNYFDLIICSHVLGHVPNEQKAVSEMFRVLKNNGVALVLTLINRDNKVTFENSEVITATERLKMYGEPDLCRLHGQDFADRLSSGGFKVTTIDYRHNFSERDRVRFGLGNGEREIIFKCEKIID